MLSSQKKPSLAGHAYGHGVAVAVGESGAKPTQRTNATVLREPSVRSVTHAHVLLVGAARAHL